MDKGHDHMISVKRESNLESNLNGAAVSIESSEMMKFNR